MSIRMSWTAYFPLDPQTTQSSMERLNRVCQTPVLSDRMSLFRSRSFCFSVLPCLPFFWVLCCTTFPPWDCVCDLCKSVKRLGRGIKGGCICLQPCHLLSSRTHYTLFVFLIHTRVFVAVWVCGGNVHTTAEITL